MLKTLWVALAFHSVGIAALSLTTSATAFFYPVGMVLTFFTQPGVLLCFAFFPFFNIPKTGQTNYISFYLTMCSAGAMLGVFAGKLLVGFTEDTLLHIAGITFQSRQLVVVLQAVFVLLSAGYIFYLSKRRARIIEPVGRPPAGHLRGCRAACYISRRVTAFSL